MDDILTAIQAIAFLLTVLGFIPYGIWIIVSMVRRKWKRVGILVASPALFWAILMGVSALMTPLIHADYLNDLYDCEADLGSPVFEYDSDRSFNGDGYSFSVYKLTPSIKKRFKSADRRLLTEFPKHPSYRDHWNFEPWREAPFDEQFNEILNFALSSYDAGNDPLLTTHFEAIRTALKRKGTFYAFFYNRPREYVADVDLFIVDLNKGLIYSINHNT